MFRLTAGTRLTATNRPVLQDGTASLYFNGSSTSINLGTPSSLINITDFTFSAFVLNTKQKSTLWGNAYASGATGQGVILGSSGAGQAGKITLFNGAGAVNDNTNNTVGKWTLVTVTQSGSSVTIYRNGLQVATGTAAQVGPTAASNSYLGSTNGATDFLKGNLSSVGIWSRALTATEVLGLYNGSTPTSGLLAYYPLNEGAGSIAYDTSGNGNNGTITSGTWTRDTPTKKRKAVNDNLVYNGDFEIAPPAATNVATASNQAWVDGTAGGSVSNQLFGWCFTKDTPAATCLFDSTEKYSGRYSLKISTTATGGTPAVRPYRSTSTVKDSWMIPALPNTSYTLTFMMKTQLNSGSADGAFVRIQEHGMTLTSLVNNETARISTTTDWTRYTLTFTTGSTTRYLAPIYYVSGSSGAATLIMDAWFDDIQLYPTTPATRSAV